MHDQGIGLGAGELLVVEPEEVEELRRWLGTRFDVMRSRWSRSIITISASFSPLCIEE